MDSWIVLQNRFVGGHENMIIPVIANCRPPGSRAKKALRFASDCLYYFVRFYYLKL
jgi:hypothetical protein